MNNELIPQPSWWKRNWKWALPLGGCMSIVFLFIAVIGSLIYGVTTVLDQSMPYEYALEKINEDEDMVSVLGAPIVKNGIISGAVNQYNGNGTANLKIPVSGSKGSGILFVKATSLNNEWTYDEIRVEIKDNEAIDLLTE